MDPIIAWAIFFGLMLVLAVRISRSAKKTDDEFYDAGMALEQFGRAYPGAAIRSLHATTDGAAVFVRLYDSKIGFMRNHRNHFACFLIQPGRVRVTSVPNANGFAAEFLDVPTQNGKFAFSSEAEAAEVSLWLLDNYVSVADRELTPAAPVSSGQASESTH